MQRLDLTFSYWIFAWFIIYFIGFVPFNPTFILLTAFVLVPLEIAYLWHLGASSYNLRKFIMIDMVFKGLPLILLWLQNNLTISANDIYFSLAFFVIYNLYLYINNSDVMSHYNGLLEGYYRNTQDTSLKTPVSVKFDDIISQMYK